MKLFKKLRKWLRCGNDCEHCPASWEERGYDDCDAGCYIHGDLWDGCHMPYLLRWFLARRPKYHLNHEYDDVGEWYEKQEAGENAIQEAIEKELADYYICYKNADGKYYETVRDMKIGDIVSSAKSAYDQFLREPRKSIRQKWAEIIKETISRPVNFIKSYIEK